MKRLIYFGTDGRHRGHRTIVIKGRCSDKEQWDISLAADAEFVHNIIECDWRDTRQPVLLHVGNYTIYAVPLSVDDDRGGCITALITDFDTHLTADKFDAEIEKNDFLKRQFDL
jgi:hypothetical protein